MKGYIPPRQFTAGVCFLCNTGCAQNNFCHYECAIAYSEEKEKRIKEAREKEREERHNLKCASEEDKQGG